jgi:hypothetical protein
MHGHLGPIALRTCESRYAETASLHPSRATSNGFVDCLRWEACNGKT